ncbi:pyridoxal 5'-phosphate synthase lyase subunit PdxS [Candidatus Woesearchaeota archaeon]|nr:pyridoxal 5'-phosphate synthase lyase subunit PdxS [Candidatus Woesearchaeota archaeon]
MENISNGQTGTFRLKKGLAEMLKGGVIMDVVNAEQARIAEKAGAVAVMALERVPADIRKSGGVARMADPKKVKEIMKAVTIPVMAKVRIGHLAEAQILQSLGVDYIDESEVLTPASNSHIDKHSFKVPFVCGARNLGEALRRINEGAAMIRTKGEPGTGNIIEAVKHINLINEEIEKLKTMPRRQLQKEAEKMRVPLELAEAARKMQRIPVVNFAAGGVATPADAALMMLLGTDGIFVGSGVFKSKNPDKMARAIVEATTNYDKPEIIAKVSAGLGDAMEGIEIEKLQLRMQDRSQ